MMEVLDAAVGLNDINLPGFDLHKLKSKPVRYSIHVNGPWTITFEWNSPKATRVDLEQYH